MTCHQCGFTHKCPNCDIPLTFHKTSNTMRCHYCGYGDRKLVTCPKCNSKDINEFGMGTQKLEQEIKQTFLIQELFVWILIQPKKEVMKNY